jgi:uncharacterized membrane protein (UPF0136 family)
MANKQRGNITLWMVIIIGFVLGYFLKRVRFGFLFGMVLAVLVVYVARRKK